MLYRILADLFLVLHLLFILFAIFGGLLVLRKTWVIFIHIPCVIWASIVNLASWICPLTPWEVRSRIAAGQAGYEGGFIENYIEPLVYIQGMTRTVEITLGAAVVLWNIVVYFVIILKLKR
jgi:hypothetical protein